MFENFPYSNFHDLNTDWLIDRVKNVETSEANAKESEENAKASEIASAQSASASAQSAQESAQSASASAQSATASANSATEANDYVTSTRAQVNLLQSRVDNIIPSGTQTEGNTELLDIRVGYNGKIYPSAGDAVRDQIENINNVMYDALEKNEFQYGITWESGTINASGSDEASNVYMRTNGYIDVSNEDTYYFIKTSSSHQAVVRQYDTNHAYLSSVTLTADTLTQMYFSEYGISYIRIVDGRQDEKCIVYRTPINYLNDQINRIENSLVNGQLEIPVKWEVGSINTSGQNVSGSGYRRTVGYIPMELNKEYRFTASISNGFIIRWYDENKTFVTSYGEKTGISGQTVENTIVARYPYCRVVNNSVDIATYPAAAGNVKIYSILSYTLSPYGYYTSLYGNRKIDCLGDSFTQPVRSWVSMIGSFTGWNMLNYGLGSSRISKDYTPPVGEVIKSFLNRYSDMDKTADGVIIFGGINDCMYLQSGVITMGDMTSPLNSDTFYGSLRLLIESIHDANFMPNCKILGIIPPDFDETIPDPDAHTTWLPLVRIAEKEIYEYYGIPYINLKTDCQEMYESAYNISKYRISSNNMHPSTDGYRAIATSIISGLEKLFIGKNFK